MNWIAEEFKYQILLIRKGKNKLRAILVLIIMPLILLLAFVRFVIVDIFEKLSDLFSSIAKFFDF